MNLANHSPLQQKNNDNNNDGDSNQGSNDSDGDDPSWCSTVHHNISGGYSHSGRASGGNLENKQ